MHHKTKIQHDSDNEKANQEKQIKELNTILSSKKESLDKVNSTIKEYRELKQRLATLKGEISNFDSLSEEVKVLLKKKEELITILKNKQSGKEWNFGEIEVQLKEKKNLSEQIQANELKIKEKDNLNNLLKDKETRLNKNQLEFETVNKAIVELKINKGLYEEKLEKNSKLLEEFALVKEQFDKILDKEKIIFGKKSGIEKEIQTVKQITELLQKDIDKKEVAKKNLEQKSQLINWLQEYFVNLLNTIEKQVMIKIQRQFNDLFVEWFSLMIENMDAELDETFTPKVQQNEHDIEIESLSGGEKTALALAYRLALNKVINDLVANIKTKNLIILDEPTDGFSTEQLDRVRDVLERLGLKQMVLVSHENKVESFVDKVLNIQKEGHISKVA